MKALLLSAYDARSHQLWREHIKALCPEIQWRELILPARYFAWRVRGNSLTWAFNHRDVFSDNYDFVLCTSMTDLCALRGFVPQLAQVPTAVYFHENQFAYPQNPDSKSAISVEPQLLSIYSALCAQEIVFNSQFNRDSFLQGASKLLKKLPDHVPNNLLESLADSRVIPVPIAQSLFQAQWPKTKPRSELNIVWNHRWEFDKGPDLLLAIIDSLIQSNIRFRFHILGQQFRQIPEAFQTIAAKLAHYYAGFNIEPGHWGYLEDRSAYEALVSSSDIVLSTASHDFQGLAILEASALGCTPLAPQCMAYPEYLPAAHLYPPPGDLVLSASMAADIICTWAEDKDNGRPLPKVDVSQFSPCSLQADYQALFTRLSDGS